MSNIDVVISSKVLTNRNEDNYPIFCYRVFNESFEKGGRFYFIHQNIKKYELDLIHDDDLLPVLEKIGLRDDFLSGKIHCVFCGDIITNENFYSLFEKNGVKFSCNKKLIISFFNTI